MGLSDDLKTQVGNIFRFRWDERDGRVVPEPEDLALGNDCVHFDRATILYADLAGSTTMVDQYDWQVAAEIYKSYLACAARLIRYEGGSITSYDGDRVMGIFIGKSQSTSAVRCALRINYAVKNIVNPALAGQYPRIGYKVRQVIGIDTSDIRAARTGVRGGNDLVWVGRAANYAAKLTQQSESMPTWITKSVLDRLSDPCFGVDQAKMWKGWKWNAQGGMQIYSSTYWTSF